MLINNINNFTPHVIFVSYTKGFPCMCQGRLVLQIDGELVGFSNNPKYKTDCPSFWESDVNCKECKRHTRLIDDRKIFNEIIIKELNSEWIINASLIPERYRQYAKEIDRVFNERVYKYCYIEYKENL